MEVFEHTMISEDNNISLTKARAFETSSLNRSTSSGVIHRAEEETRSSVRHTPERKVLSTSFKELLPSMQASSENFSGGSSVVLYRQGAQTFCCLQ
jgi:hypothetical protein